MLKFKNVTFAYKNNEVPVIDNISFEIKDGSFTSIIGASGSGKTTIFRLINSLEVPDGGNITIDGIDIGALGHYAGYMPQQDLLFPWRTVIKNVMLPMEVNKAHKEEARNAALHILEKVGLKEWADKYPRDLSGGMRQRVSFARTLCTGSKLLLLDEPFCSLDSITRIELQQWLMRQWNAMDKTILFITHDVDEAIFLSEKILVLSGKPVNRIYEFEVPLGSKRNRSMLYGSPVEKFKEELTSILRREAER